jgi:hypothetical protein
MTHTYGYLKRMLEQLNKCSELDPVLMAWIETWTPQKLAKPLPAELNSLVDALNRGLGRKVTSGSVAQAPIMPEGAHKLLTVRTQSPVILLEEYC